MIGNRLRENAMKKQNRRTVKRKTKKSINIVRYCDNDMKFWRALTGTEWSRNVVNGTNIISIQMEQKYFVRLEKGKGLNRNGHENLKLVKSMKETPDRSVNII